MRRLVRSELVELRAFLVLPPLSGDWQLALWVPERHVSWMAR